MNEIHNGEKENADDDGYHYVSSNKGRPDQIDQEKYYDRTEDDCVSGSVSDAWSTDTESEDFTGDSEEDSYDDAYTSDGSHYQTAYRNNYDREKE